MSEEEILHNLRRTVKPGEAVRLTGPQGQLYGRVVIEEIPDHRADLRIEAPDTTTITVEPA